MTSRDTTGLWTTAETHLSRPLSEKMLVAGWAVIQWPWLLRSLSGGRKSDKYALLDDLALPHDALPNLGSWKADCFFLAQIIATIDEIRPRTVVELGCGATSLIIAKTLERSGGGRLVGYDQHADFVEATGRWLAQHDLRADLRHAPIQASSGDWASCWYDLDDVPDRIDLLVIDGPPWTLNPFVRGEAEVLFDRVSPGGRILLDDAARPGERMVARRWRRRWPDIEFRFLSGGTKGMLEGRKRGLYSQEP
jgi:predicted O-methyltransferase YrrM